MYLDPYLGNLIELNNNDFNTGVASEEIRVIKKHAPGRTKFLAPSHTLNYITKAYAEFGENAYLIGQRA
jgi:hypothetical protein